MDLGNSLSRISRVTMLAGAVLSVAALPAYATPVGGASDTGPAMVEFTTSAGSALCVAWSGTDSSHHLNISCSTNPATGGFQTQETNQLSASAPALAVFNNTLYMAWTGTDSNHTLNIAQVTPTPGSTSPLTLSGSVVGNHDASSQAPALAVAEFGGSERLVIAWTGTDSHHHLNFSSSASPTVSSSWAATTTLNQLALGGPSLATLSGTLYIAWTGTDVSGTQNFASATLNNSSNSLSFGAAQQAKFNGSTFKSPEAPSIAVAPSGTLYSEWVGTDNSVNIGFLPNLPSPAASGTETIPGVETGAPAALATFDGGLWLGWLNLSNNLQVEPIS